MKCILLLSLTREVKLCSRKYTRLRNECFPVFIVSTDVTRTDECLSGNIWNVRKNAIAWSTSCYTYCKIRETFAVSIRVSLSNRKIIDLCIRPNTRKYTSANNTNTRIYRLTSEHCGGAGVTVDRSCPDFELSSPAEQQKWVSNEYRTPTVGYYYRYIRLNWAFTKHYYYYYYRIYALSLLIIPFLILLLNVSLLTMLREII